MGIPYKTVLCDTNKCHINKIGNLVPNEHPPLINRFPHPPYKKFFVYLIKTFYRTEI